jgi:hypothetical protein
LGVTFRGGAARAPFGVLDRHVIRLRPSSRNSKGGAVLRRWLPRIPPVHRLLAASLASLKERDMLDIRSKMIVAISVTTFGVLPANVALSKANDVRLAGSDQTKTLDCAGGWARIAGANNKVTLNGNCAGLTIYGSRNTVTVALQAGAHVRFVGSNNAVTWKTQDAKEPTVLHLGVGNTMTPEH